MINSNGTGKRKAFLFFLTGIFLLFSKGGVTVHQCKKKGTEFLSIYSIQQQHPPHFSRYHPNHSHQETTIYHIPASDLLLIYSFFIDFFF